MEQMLTVCGTPYRLLRLLGRGKGGYSYLAEGEPGQVVLKQIHHEPCAYYTTASATRSRPRPGTMTGSGPPGSGFPLCLPWTGKRNGS